VNRSSSIRRSRSGGLQSLVSGHAGEANAAVIGKYLLEAAEEIEAKGVRLSERLYVREHLNEARKSEIAARQPAKLAFLQSPEDDVQFKMALLLGEYQRSEASIFARKVWIEHMPEAPLFVDAKAWGRIERAYGSLFEARDADTKTKPRLVMGALIYAKREHIYQIDRASFMLTAQNWIPIEGSTSWISSKPCQHSPRGVASALPRYRAAVRSGTLPPSVRRNAAASRIAASAASKRARISNS